MRVEKKNPCDCGPNGNTVLGRLGVYIPTETGDDSSLQSKNDSERNSVLELVVRFFSPVVEVVINENKTDRLSIFKK